MTSNTKVNNPRANNGATKTNGTTTSCSPPCICCNHSPCSSKKTQIPIVSPLGPPVDNKCGGNEWKVWFNLPEVTCNGGWIVQEVKYSIDSKRQNGTVISNETYHFWEAWEVEKCKKVTVWQDKRRDDNDDSYTDLSSPNTKGSYITIGKLKFYEGPLPPDFKQNNRLTLAGILHSTTTKPGFWDGSGATHNLTSTWDCTDGNMNASVITTVP